SLHIRATSLAQLGDFDSGPRGGTVHGQPDGGDSLIGRANRSCDRYGRKEPDVRRSRPVPRGRSPSGRATSVTPAFFTPMAEGPAGERNYQDLRRQVESQMGRPPNERRIMEIWTRRGNRDCVTA